MKFIHVWAWYSIQPNTKKTTYIGTSSLPGGQPGIHFGEQLLRGTGRLLQPQPRQQPPGDQL